MSEPEITIITPSLGRPSLQKLAECIAKQTYQNFVWLVVFDGSDSCKAGQQYLPATAQFYITHAGAPAGPSGEIVRLKALDQVKTKYMAFMDDDNEFHPDHIAALMLGFKYGARFVSTRRLYTDENMVPIAKEHINSELCDTNCTAIETELLREVAQFSKDNWKLSTPFYDRNLQAYLYARGIRAQIINAYTVLYKINPKDSPEWSRGYEIFETLCSIRFHFGDWDMKTGAAPLMP